jgi:putative membrane protein
MSERPYERFTEDELILRDHLATDRTVLANERTLLAYVRTALAFAVAGVGLLKFFDDRTVDVIAWFFNVCGVATIAIGIHRYRAVARAYEHLRRRQQERASGTTDPQAPGSGA